MPPPRRALLTSLLRLRAFSSIASPHPHPPAPPRRHQFVTDPTASTSRNVVGAIGGGSGNPLDPTQLLREDPVAITASLWVSSFRAAAAAASATAPASSTPAPPQSLTPFLSRLELWVLAYQKAYADETGSYLPRSSIPASTLASLLSLRNAVLDARFRFGNRLTPFLQSPRAANAPDPATLSKRKLRALLTTPGPPPFQDRVVQELLLLLLEPVYEARFSPKSFAFRPGRSPHAAIRTIRRSFAPYLWYIKGDLSPLLHSPDPALVVGALIRDVRDKKVVDLIRSALLTPVVTASDDAGVKKKKTKRKYQKKKVLPEGEPKPDPYWLQTFFGFAPEEAQMQPDWGHCGVLSPLLANVCLDELDKWMEEKIKEFYKPSKSDVVGGDDGIEQGNTSWPEFVPTSGPDKTRKVDYIRYGGHFLIGVRGPRADAAVLRKQLVEFCDQRFRIKLDNENLPIEHITKGIMFLDHVLCRRVVYPTLRYTATGGKIISEKGVGTLLSVTASLKQCIKQFRKLEFLKGDREPDPQPCFRMFHATQAHTNSQMNKLLLTMAEWYRYADNRKKVVNFCSYIIRGSLAKLYAAKYKLRSRAKVYKIASRNLSRPLKDKKGQSPEYHNLLRMGLVDSIDGLQYTRMSMVPDPDYTPLPSGWRPDHEKILLEYIKLTDQQTLEEQRACIREEGLITPQDYISMLVWGYKKNAVLLPSSKDSDAHGSTEDLGSDTDELGEKELGNEGCQCFPKFAEMS
ncbi:putative mitochondrial protein ymf11-like [Panicum miliaceum]|uniref:Mitochondrial protein ymf11-like n=1 Tax=Panicum miliaceum TaxID=4540 RepID=A0A3L6SAR6_PANMI|nr:putative mitochondrial protein ymf11-like [Panicum miliaceum]